MDCKACHAQCKAACCGMCPMPLDLFERNKDKIVQHPQKVQLWQSPDVKGDLSMPSLQEMKDVSNNIDMVLPITKNMKCCFLNEDYSCNIYEDRPNICRKFGDESHIYMTCCYQSKDGRIRSRQERRSLERQCEGATDKLAVINQVLKK